MGRIAILTHTYSPDVNGQSIMLARILVNEKKDRYRIYTSNPNVTEASHPYGKVIKINVRYKLRGTNVFVKFYNLLTTTIQKIFKISTSMQLSNASKVVACTGDPTDIFAGFLLSRILGYKFYFYLFDDYLFQWHGSFVGTLVRITSRIISKGTMTTIVPNEYLKDRYEAIGFKNVVIVRNPFRGRRRQVGLIKRKRRHLDITYTGSVYYAQSDAIIEFIKAVESVNRVSNVKMKIHIYTADEVQYLKKYGRCVVLHKANSNIDLIQCQSNILYLPLSFNLRYKGIIETSCPGKLAEYLSSGVDIIGHFPEYSYLSWFFEKYECGYLINSNDMRSIKSKISVILSSILQSRARINRKNILLADRLFSAQSSYRSFLSAIS